MEAIQANATNSPLTDVQSNFITKNLIEFLIKEFNFWTASHQKKGCMGITCSWLSEDFEPVETLLNLFHVPHPHTNLVTKNLIEEEILKWNLEGKITAITTNNGSNMISGSRLLKNSLNIERISCIAHTLQLCVKKALNCDDKIKALVLRARKLILFFNSPKQLEALFNVQERLREDYPTNLKPIHDVATRWNSTYNSWVRLLNLKKAIIILQSHMILDSDPETRKSGRKLQKSLLTEIN
ncbi:5767_t:CDS:2 [Entrophospora sp. SA101]|nr:5767_t:CDS:2 [Entrophospora sp. SA101]